LSTHWDGIKRRTIAGVDTFYETDLYAGAAQLNQEKFALLLKSKNLGWDIDDSRNPPRLKIDKETFRTMAKANQYWQPLHEAQHMLGGMRLNDLQVGDDGYNRVLISPFASRTGRCQPSSAKFVFGPSRCYRSLIKPPEGYGVAYIDWVQQEFGVAASLSQDANMKAAYESEDSYIWFAIQAGAAPPGATKHTHSIIRNQFKSTVLGVQFGMGPYTLATRLGVPPIDAKHLLKLHRLTFPDYWTWQESAIRYARFNNEIHTCYGWTQHIGPADRNADLVKRLSLGNFPMQAHGAEMLRMACIEGIKVGTVVIAPVHDAVMIMGPVERLGDDIVRMRAIMADVSRAVLTDPDGFGLKTDVKRFDWPARYVDEAGLAMWNKMQRYLALEEGSTPVWTDEKGIDHGGATGV
jgi:DNA polymerase I